MRGLVRSRRSSAGSVGEGVVPYTLSHSECLGCNSHRQEREATGRDIQRKLLEKLLDCAGQKVGGSEPKAVLTRWLPFVG